MQTTDNPFVATWSAKGHTLCLGHWQITFHGLNLVLPEAKAQNHMDTQKIFSWLFPDDEDYTEGLALPDWIEQHGDWLMDVFDNHNIPFDQQHIQWFYAAVNENDWRCASCGGCL